jgi:hypothetical protein
MKSQYCATTEHPKYMSSNTAKGLHVKAQNKCYVTNPSLGISAVLGLASVSIVLQPRRHKYSITGKTKKTLKMALQENKSSYYS